MGIVTLLLSGLLSGSPYDSLFILPEHLDLEVAVHYRGERIEGTATWMVRNVGGDPVRRVPVQLGRLMTARAVSSEGRSLDYTEDVVAYADWPTRQVTQLWVRLPAPLPPGEAAAVTVSYAGYLVPYTETGMLYVRDHVDPAFTILRAESFGFPQIGVASLAATRSMPRRDFTYHLRIAVPGDLVVATGVPPAARTQTDSLARWEFLGDVAVPFLNVAIAPYEVLSDGDLRVFHFPEDAPGARTVMRAMGDARGLYERWFGRIEAPARLHVIEIPEGWGSQAHLNAGIMQTASAFRGTEALPELYHELAHLWHPLDRDPVPPRWNEGLATFLQFRVAATLDDGSRLAERFDDLAARHVGELSASESATIAMIDYGREGLTGRSYRTGALMFYALWGALGEETFDRALSSWFRDHRAAGSTTQQFVTVMRNEAGRDLERLFSDWLYSSRWYERLRAGESLGTIISGY